MLEFINTESNTKTHHNGNTYHFYSTMHFLTAHRSLYETVLKGLEIENHITNHIEQRQWKVCKSGGVCCNRRSLLTSQVLLTNLPKPRGVKPRDGGLFVPTFPSAL